MRKLEVGEVVNGLQVVHAVGEPHTYMKRGQRVQHSHRTYTRYSLVCLKCGGRSSVKPQSNAAVSIIGCKRGPCAVNFRDLSGQTFGDLTVEELVYRPELKDGAVRWRVRCSCGKTEVIKANSLLYQGKSSCRPCSRKRQADKLRLPENLKWWHKLITQTKRNAGHAGRSYTLTDDEFIAISKSPCYYCGAEPALDAYGIRRNGIDRVDNNEGYTLENSKAACFKCNRIKYTDSYKDLLIHLEKMLTYNKKRSTTIPTGSTAKRPETKRARRGLDIV